MFERYTESARRALFFARYEVSHLGATELGTEHLLLGLIRESQGPVARIMAASHVSFERLRREIEGRSAFRERTATSVEIPLGAETQRALQFAAEEADRLGHSCIGTEHLLLGLLRDETSLAASILIRHGLRPDDVRNDLLKLLAEPPSPSIPSAPVDVSAQIDRITHLVEQLARMASDRSEARALTDRIRDSLNELRRHLGG